MEATPLEQDVVAVAAMFAVDPIVLPLPGLTTVTPAKAGSAAKIKEKITTCFLMYSGLSWEKVKSFLRLARNVGIAPIRRNTLS